MDSQIHLDVDTITSFVIQSGQVLEVERSQCHVMFIKEHHSQILVYEL